ncbi:hypothetical protein ON010_g12386 [Phytophthora cinnamomi]|nr:hypothetical protein ON010_g12386 [Phytophthora cinnamomi]
MFPDLLDSSDDDHESSSRKALIANKLLGERVVMRGTTRFEWDCIFGRISSMSDDFDLLTPILSRLGALVDVAVLFEKSPARLDLRPSDFLF